MRLRTTSFEEDKEGVEEGDDGEYLPAELAKTSTSTTGIIYF